jgi:hypothetical protein
VEQRLRHEDVQLVARDNLKEWIETTGALSPKSSFAFELESILREAVTSAYLAGRRDAHLNSR